MSPKKPPVLVASAQQLPFLVRERLKELEQATPLECGELLLAFIALDSDAMNIIKDETPTLRRSSW